IDLFGSCQDDANRIAALQRDWNNHAIFDNLRSSFSDVQELKDGVRFAYRLDERSDMAERVGGGELSTGTKTRDKLTLPVSWSTKPRAVGGMKRVATLALRET